MIQELDPESGSQCTHHFALHKAAAVKVSAANEHLFSFFLIAGVVKSPNYPGNYSNNLAKTETIEVESGKILRLEFTHFAVQDCGNISTCSCDFVKIRDGDGITLMDRSCGYSSIEPSHRSFFLPPIILTGTNRVEIFFGTDDDYTSTGWSLGWSAIDHPNFCCGAAVSTVQSDDQQAGQAVWSLSLTACQNITNGVSLGLR